MKQRIITLTLISVALFGCAAPDFVKTATEWVVPTGEKLQWQSLRLQPQPNANQNSPVALDIVLALDAVTADKLEALTGAQWHQQREGLLGGLQGLAVVLRFELTPGDGILVAEDALPKERAMRVLAFANLKGDAPGRLRLNPRARHLLIEIGETDLRMRADPPSRTSP